MKEHEDSNERIIGEKYEICGELGQGGGGQVFRVYDKRLDQFWAAKRVGKNSSRLEERMLTKAAGSAFPRIVDVVEEENCRYLIMDWIDGETLEEKLKRTGAFSAKEALQIGIGICDAIGALHKMQPPFVYLDCKPSNIMTDREGKLWLIDFGSAAVLGETEAVPIAVSPGFAAPELVGAKEDRRADVRTDVFGLGRTLYALLSACNPAKPPYTAIRLKDCRPDIPRKLAAVVEKCMEEKPERRFQTMDGVKAVLQEQLEDLKKNLFCRMLHPLFFWLLLMLAVWQCLIFYRDVSAGFLNVKNALAKLFLTAMFIEAASLWRYFCKKTGPGRAAFEPLQSVMRTEKKAGRWLIAFWIGLLLALPAEVPVAAKETVAAKILPVILRDDKMRKLLVKKDAVLQSGERLYLELDPALFEKGRELEIYMTAKSADGREIYEYVLRYCPMGEGE